MFRLRFEGKLVIVMIFCFILGGGREVVVCTLR